MDRIIGSYAKTIHSKTGKVPKEIAILGIMESYGWTYDEYLNTPSWIIDLIFQKSEIDYRKQKLQSKK